MAFIWNIPLVVLSVLIAMVGSFTALIHAQRMRMNSGSIAQVWMIAGGTTLGLAIWSMHFIGMLAFQLPMPLGYDLGLTVLSALPAIAAALLGFYILSSPTISLRRIATSGVLMGIGISTMHYTGMAALRMSPAISYDAWVLVLSILVAVIASWGALLMMYQGERIKSPPMLRFLLGAFIMGLAISGMHYSAMFGMVIAPDSICMAGASRIEPAMLAVTLAMISMLWFGGGILATLFDQRMEQQAIRSLQQLSEVHETLLQTLPVPIFYKDAQGRYSGCNIHFCEFIGKSQNDIIGKTVFEVSPQNLAEKYYDKDMDLLREGAGTQVYESRVKHADGTLHDVVFHKARMLDKSGKPVGIIGVILDISMLKHVEEELRTNESKLQMLMDNAVDAVFVADAKSERWIYTNDRVGRLLGYSSEELNQMSIYDLVPPSFRETYQQKFRSIAQSSTDMTWSFESRLIRKNGSRVSVELNMVRLPDGNMYGSCRDITDRKQIEEELRISATAFESQEGMMVTDANQKILRVNRAFTKLTGYSNEEVMGQTPSILKSDHQDAAFYHDMWLKLKYDKYWEGEIWNKRKNGEVYPEWLSITAICDAARQVTHYVGSFNDISERKAAEATINRMAFFDPLTNLPNRRLLLDRLEHAQASSMRSNMYGAVMFIDLDNFKTLNDSRGHNVGDMLLVEVAHRLTSCVRFGDTVARLGGDEFVVILENLNTENREAAALSETVAEKILMAIRQPFLIGGIEHHCTASIGITLWLNQGSSEELLKRADLAMYQSKKSGRNSIRFFDPDMQAAIDARVALEADLRMALKLQQFNLLFQVQVNTNGVASGAEVLLSWQHPVRGLVSPSRFIPLAEEAGMIVPIGQWVLEASCAQIKQWQAHATFRDLILAVNVSAKQFHQSNFVEQVQRVVMAHGINPALLKLELTESMVLENVEEAIAKMKVLKNFGVRFSLDDFGTGYSSLTHLKRLPLDQLKIDQAFVRDLASDNADKVMVMAIVDLGMSFELDVIAEGVETEEQFKLLQRYGCANFQGYLFSRPIAVEQFEQKVMQGFFVKSRQ